MNKVPNLNDMWKHRWLRYSYYTTS